jgi:dimethylhistidine N-methyltransferase
MDNQFLEDVKKGLTSSPKYLFSRYFYDEAGDQLFQQIMGLDEYYLTDCEYEILSTHRAALLKHFRSECDLFHLVEFGAGDAYKTKILLGHLLEQDVDFQYNPIDISGHAIDKLVGDLKTSYPLLSVESMNHEYFRAVEDLSLKSACKKIILFLGSNIGNFTCKETDAFFGRLAEILKPGDQLLVGFDLKKDPAVILAAYNDSKGITRDFNLNLLRRINRELDADFELDGFYHRPVYDIENGAALSYLVSRQNQKVSIRAIPAEIEFDREEPIFVEISQKFSLDDIAGFAARAGFRIIDNFFDEREYFVNSLWEQD